MIKKSLIIFVLLSVVASALNYLAYPLFSRILGPTDYINITVALSLFTQVSTFLSSILAITIGLSKTNKNNLKNTGDSIELLQAFLFKLFFVLSIIFLVFSPFIMESVRTPTLFAIPIALMMLLSIPVLIISGYLNGKNQMVKLGIVTFISASSQFTIGLLASIAFHSGLVTMLSMVAAQAITIVIVYTVYSKEKLPGILKSLRTPLRNIRTPEMKRLIVFTVISSLAIMSISIIQVADLFFVQHLKGADVKFYADIYVLSRVVFFAGMIFVWPFLGEISIDNYDKNRKPFLKVFTYFAIITALAALGILLFGDKISWLLFGVSYELSLITEIGLLSISYKFLLLIITAIILYFVVLRNYAAIWLSLITTLLIMGVSLLLNRQLNITTLLTTLNIIALISTVTGLILVVINTRNKQLN